MVTEPIPQLAEILRWRGAVSDGERADNHYRIVGDAETGGARLQWSGRMRVWEADPRFAARGLKRDIRRAFPQLGAVEPAYLWRGTLGRAVHRMPQIGEIEPGFWVASGFGGHGLNTTAMAGELIARGIVENDQTWRLFAPYELVWAGGGLGRALAQGIYWGSRPLDRAGAGAGALPRGAPAAQSGAAWRRAGSAAPVPASPGGGDERAGVSDMLGRCNAAAIRQIQTGIGAPWRLVGHGLC